MKRMDMTPSDPNDPYPDDHDYDDGDCWNCGGEGFVYSCFDGFCLNAEEGCDDCARPCEVCNRKNREAS